MIIEKVFDIISYSPERLTEWNNFVAQSKNGTFLFDRGYMDYHSDRFTDASLMVHDAHGHLFALFPANRVGDVVYSHQGLSYGALLLTEKAKTADVCEALQAVNAFLCQQGVRRVLLKAIPWFYCSVPSEEPLYALTEVCHARLLSRDVASVVSLEHHPAASKLRIRGRNKAERHEVYISYADDLATFWQILNDNLHDKYGSKPVHTLYEMRLLQSRFPEHIRLLAAFEGSTMIGGTLLYHTGRVVKTQYISASLRGKELCALDLLFSQLISSPPALGLPPRYLDMGTSALDHSTALRLPLIFQKEGFGARAVCFDTYEWQL